MNFTNGVISQSGWTLRSGSAKLLIPLNGEMSEWFKEHAWKACVGETLPWVRIPLSPPVQPICFQQLTVLREFQRAARRGIFVNVFTCRRLFTSPSTY